MSRQNLYILYTVSFIDFFAVSLFYPLLIPHLKTLGASHITIGVFGSVYSTIQIVSSPIIGSWSDVRGQKLIFIVSLLICSVGYFLLGITSSLGVLFGLRMFLGLFKHTRVLSRALGTKLVAPNQHAEVLGKLSSFAVFGFFIGPLVGGYLSDFNDAFFYACLLTSILFIFNVGLVCLVQQSATSSVKKTHSSITQGLKNEVSRTVQGIIYINWKTHWDIFVLRLLFGIAISLFFSNQAFIIRNRYDLPQRYIGYVMSFISGLGCITGFMSGFIKAKFYSDDFNRSRQLLHSFVVLMLSYLFMYCFSSVTVFVLSLFFISVTSIILRNVTTEVMLNCSDEDKRGSLAGASSSLMSFARSVSPITNGVMNNFFGEDSTILLAALPAALGSLLCIKLFKNKKLKDS